jgi:glutamate-1-semialdehyde 2,1-aminomutase
VYEGGRQMTRGEIIKEATDKYEAVYINRTLRSQAALYDAKRVLPGGDSRISTFFYPHPIFLDKGSGCQIIDLDGNEYIDFHNCYTALIHGHAETKLVEAVRTVIGRFAAALGAPTILITEWAETLKRRVDSIDKVRFCNSGTEAAMLAVRAARAFTGKNKVLKLEGGYSGSYDTVVHPPNAAGLPKSVAADQITVSFNDKKAAEKAIRENKDELACMIVEGMMGAAGQIPPKDGYLEYLRALTLENGVILILDEVMTFRLDYGGIQRIFGIKPDLTIFGKIIGGGFPVGALGGRGDIMELFDPIKGRFLVQESPGLPAMAQLFHGGTFNANPVVAAAGKVALESLTAEEIARINRLGESLAQGIRNVSTELKIKAQVTGIGSLQNVHFTPEQVVDFRTAQTSEKELMHLVHLGLLERGIFLPARGLFCISTPMTDKEIDLAIDAMGQVMQELKPIMKQAWPELLVR